MVLLFSEHTMVLLCLLTWCSVILCLLASSRSCTHSLLEPAAQPPHDDTTTETLLAECDSTSLAAQTIAATAADSLLQMLAERAVIHKPADSVNNIDFGTGLCASGIVRAESIYASAGL